MVELVNDHERLAVAERYLVGGVNSPVRSFRGVGGAPVFMQRGAGARLGSDDGKEYLDFCLSWGALLAGHAHPEVTAALQRALVKGTSFGTATTLETELARELCEAVPSLQRVRLTSSGTEAVMSAVRLARGYSGKKKIIKCAGAYHGHADYLLATAGSGLATFGVPDSAGVPEDFTRHTLVVPYNDSETMRETVRLCRDDLAAIIIEPVAGNCGVIVPQPEWLAAVRRLADESGAVLIFDEVITGFRLSYGGAQEYFAVTPDITCLGKIVGGGLPIGLFGGKAEIMEQLAPGGPVYQAGTLSGNPLAVTAGLTTLRLLRQQKPYHVLQEKTEYLATAIEAAAERQAIPVRVNRIASMFSIFFTEREVVDYQTAQTQDRDRFRRFYHGLLARGVYLSPSGFEADFLSIAHSDSDIEQSIKAIAQSLAAL